MRTEEWNYRASINAVQIVPKDGVAVTTPLGDYGGPTPTMPPLPGSPALDVATAIANLTADQRALLRPVGSLPDLGSTEYQGSADLGRFWLLDLDGDGTAYGLEYALGTNPWSPDLSDPRRLTAFADGTGVGVSFGIDVNATAHTAWVLNRSYDLSPGSFVEIYRFNGPGDTATAESGITVTYSVGIARIRAASTPAHPRAFYTVTAEFIP